MAGESARGVARRNRARAERALRSAERWERGAEGEERTAVALDALPEGWRVLHDVHWPGRRFANIDHVVVGPSGVFVIDSKNWSGEVVLDEGVLRQNGRSRQVAVDLVGQAALSVLGLAPSLGAPQVHAVLCFVRDEPLVGRAGGVLLCTTGNVVELLTSWPRVFTDLQVKAVWMQLAAAFGTAERVAPRSALGPARAGARVRSGRTPASRVSTPRQRRARRQRRLLTQGVLALGLAAVLILSPPVAERAERLFDGIVTGLFADDDGAIRPVNGTPGERPGTDVRPERTVTDPRN